MRSFQTKDYLICKLFAKHLKIKDQVEALNTDVRIAIGTPNRLLKLADAGALLLDRVEHIIVDCGKDAKDANIFDIKATKMDFFELFHKYLVSHLKSRNGRARLCLY